MPRLRARWLLLAALAVAPAPALAGPAYIPLLNPLANDGSTSSTEVWLANPGSAQTAFTPGVSDVDTDGSQPPTTGSMAVLPGRSMQLTNLAQSGKFSLLNLQLGSGITVDARVTTTSTDGRVVVTRVPVISAANQIASGAKAELLNLDRDPESGKLVDLGVMNLASKPAQCTLAFFGADGVQLAPAVPLTLKPVSLVHFHDALGANGFGRVTAVRAEVSCDQTFYPYAALFRWPSSHWLFVTPSVAGTASTTTTDPPPGGGGGSGGGGGGSGGGGGAGGGNGGGDGGGSGNSVVFQRTGLVHSASVDHPKGIVQVNVGKALSLRKLILDMDVIPGPWNTQKVPGNHGIVWLYRGRFRGNTVANVNAFGPNKFTIKANQNVDLAAHQVTTAETGLTLVQGRTYHLHYTYDAEHNVITVEMSTGGTVLKSFSFAGTASGHILTIPANGMVAEFGHYFGQEGPEVASPGWNYYDLRVEMVPY